MAIIVTTEHPKRLLADIKAEIDSGAITTWSYDEDGDFTHAPDRWKYKAWLRPSTTEAELVLTILPPKGKTISRSAYAVYHGKFIEMLLTHFDEKFGGARATALPAKGDKVRSVSAGSGVR